MTKRPFGGTNKKSIKVSGFRARMKISSGKNIISLRRKKNRKILAIS